MMTNVGVAVTTLNRHDIFLDTMRALVKYTPGARISVVDDGSGRPVPGADIRNPRPLGVAAAKNQCLALLTAWRGIDHLFLFDDDCRPTKPDWWRPYVESGEHHLSFLHANGDPNAKIIHDDGRLFAMNTGTGCMLYYTRACIATVGGMRTDFGRWSFEHLEHSQRIHNTGLTRFPFQDVHQDGLWSLDQQEHGHSSVPRSVRAEHYARNQRIWDRYRHSTGFVPYT